VMKRKAVKEGGRKKQDDDENLIGKGNRPQNGTTKLGVEKRKIKIKERRRCSNDNQRTCIVAPLRGILGSLVAFL